MTQWRLEMWTHLEPWVHFFLYFLYSLIIIIYSTLCHHYQHRTTQRHERLYDASTDINGECGPVRLPLVMAHYHTTAPNDDNRARDLVLV